MTSSVDLRDGARAEIDQLRTSARGWHGVQLAVLGFIGLCGALHDAADAPGPMWVQQVAAVLVLLALAVACVATVLVAIEAWPLRGKYRLSSLSSPISRLMPSTRRYVGTAATPAAPTSLTSVDATRRSPR